VTGESFAETVEMRADADAAGRAEPESAASPTTSANPEVHDAR
jgi:hypothetical protein